MSVFYTGNKDLFLNTLGINYGFLGIEGAQVQGMVVDIENARAFLSQLVSQNTITSDEAQDLENSMRKARIVEDQKGLVNIALSYKLPDDLDPEFTVRMCDDGKGHPLFQHFHIDCVEAHDVGGPIITIVDGFNLCHTLGRNAEGDMDKILDVIHVFQQIANSDMPFDEKDRLERYNKLSKKERKEVDQVMRGARMTSLRDVLGAIFSGSLGRGF